jgi:hypothetical protein
MTDEPKKDSRSRFRAMLGEGEEKKQPEKKSSLLTRNRTLQHFCRRRQVRLLHPPPNL